MKRTVYLIVAAEIDDRHPDKTDNDVRREVQQRLIGTGYEVTIPS